MSEKAKKVAIDWVSSNESMINNVHNQIWELAEVGLQEVKTADILIDILEKNGFTVEKGVAGMPSAFVATWGQGKPVIGIMGELDALPGISQKKLPYKETLKEGAAGHGCGHHGYATAALGGAIAAKVAMEEGGIKGTVKCFGCPAEETLVGKVYMVRDGLFDGVDAALGHHPGAMNGARLGSGNAMNSVKFEFYGRSSHAAGDPENGISAMDGVELMNIGVNFLREHVTQETRIHYVVEDGGHEPNVVPPYARSWYYVRAIERELVNQYYQRILEIADGADKMAGTTHTVRFLTGVHNGIPNKVLAETIVANMRMIGAPTYTEEEEEFAAEMAKSFSKEQKMMGLTKWRIPGARELADVNLNTNIYDPFGEGQRGGGSSDVADVAWNLPTQQFSTTSFVLGAPGHSWQHVAASGTSIGEKSSVFASKVMAATTLDLLMNAELLQKAKEDWKERMAGRTYKCPLPPDLKPPLDQLESH